MPNSAENFKTDNFVKLPALISKEICDLMARYILLKRDLKPNIRRGKDPLANIHREYGDPLMEVILGDITKQIEAVTGISLWPTLSFCYGYQKGNELMAHKDRASCEIVVSLKIGCDEQYKKDFDDWPLYFKHQEKSQNVQLDVGDALIIKGHEIEHWREPFEGEWFASAIFAFVDKNGKNAYQKFDQRKKLGKPHIGIFRWYGRMLWEKYKPNLMGSK